MSSKFLVVDDEEPVRDLFMDLLKREKYTAKSASSGEEALEIIKQEDFDVALLDIKLTGISGFEVLKKIKEIKPGIIAVMITGFGFNEDLIAKSKEYGASGYVGKNVPTSEIIAILKLYAEMAQEKDSG